MSDNSAKWYVIHTYSGYENAVRASIEKFVVGRNMSDRILQMEVPVERVTEVKSESDEDGAVHEVSRDVERKIFPGYVFIKMVMSDETWHLVRNVRGVTGFVGTANNAIPLSDGEVIAMGLEKPPETTEEDVIPQRPIIKVRYQVGDTVRILDGPMVSQTGVVDEIEPEKNRVSVVLHMFGGRDMLIDFELDQVALVE